jgi:hypothetical protein
VADQSTAVAAVGVHASGRWIQIEREGKVFRYRVFKPRQVKEVEGIQVATEVVPNAQLITVKLHARLSAFDLSKPEDKADARTGRNWRWFHQGEPVLVENGAEWKQGTFVGVDATGALRVRVTVQDRTPVWPCQPDQVKKPGPKRAGRARRQWGVQERGRL